MKLLLLVGALCLSRLATAAPSVSCNITSLAYNGEYVNVTYSGVTNPTGADAVALVYSGMNLTTSVPLKYKFCVDSPNYLSTGAGSLTFRLLNMRDDYQFLLFSNISAYQNFSQPEVIASSQVITIDNPNEPTQLHLGVTPNPDALRITWITRDAGNPIAKYGLSSGDYTSVVNGTTTTYTINDMCNTPANSTGWLDPGTINTAVMTDLAYSTKYYYVVGDDDFGFSAEYSFLTAPPVGPDASVKILANADPGHAEIDGSNEWETDLNTRLVFPVDSLSEIYSSISNQLAGNGLEQGASLPVLDGMMANSDGRTLAFFNGDLSYARGFAVQWDVHFDQFMPIATQMPVVVVEGNHERDSPFTGDRFQDTATDSGGECGVPTYQRYIMPVAVPLPEGAPLYEQKFYYSFDFGPIHFLQYSTEIDYSAGSDQNNFILADLSSVNRSLTPWVIANLHRPIYTTSISGVSQSSDLQGAADQRAALEDLFMEYQVDMTLAGHVHLYERTCNVYQRTCVPNNADGSSNAPMHLTIGNGGQWLSIFTAPELPEFVESLAIEHGWLKYEVNSTTLYAEMISALDGRVMDSFSLYKPPGWTASPSNQSTLMSSFVPTTNFSFIIETGVDGGLTSTIENTAMAILAENPALYDSIANNTLVRDLNAPDTLADALTNLQPVVAQLTDPKLLNNPNITAEHKMIINEVLLPIFNVLDRAEDGQIRIAGKDVLSAVGSGFYGTA